MARTKTKTQKDTETCRTPRHNRHVEETFFVVFFWIFCIDNFLNEFSKKTKEHDIS